MSSISAGTTTTTGYVVSSDTTGSLVLKTGASATTAVTVDTSQRLLAGLSSNLSGSRLQVQGATDTGLSALTINASTNDGYMGIGYSSSGSTWQIWPTYNATAGYKPLAFVVGGSEVARFPTASGFQCVNSISVGNATPTTSGAGITFPATQSASSNANTLDDYEEGTWTPATVNYTGSLTFVRGSYIKIGRLVSIQLQCSTSDDSTSTGNFSITGLPFSSQTNAQSYSTFSTCCYQNPTGTAISGGQINPNSTSIRMLKKTSATSSTWSDWIGSDVNSGEINMTFTYESNA
jgi:hypothetical protein